MVSIILNVIMRSKDISEYRRIRVENRELEIKAMALNDMKSLAFEFQQLVFLADTIFGYDRRDFGTRFSNMLFEYTSMVKYADLFSEQLREKAKSLANCIGDFEKELTSREFIDKGVMFVLDTKERVEIRDRVIKSVDELHDAITR